jgi:hypothetical protein
MIAWMIFCHPMVLRENGWTLWLMLPLCVSAAIIYKTLRASSLRRLPLEILAAMCYIVVGLAVLGLGLWGVCELML